MILPKAATTATASSGSRNHPSRDERLLWLDREIRAHSFPDPERFCQELGVSRRTAYSDLAHLRDTLSAPGDWDPEEKGWYYTEPDFVLPLLRDLSRL